MRDHRALGIKHVPIEREYLTYKSMVWPLRRENDALKAENERLKQELQACKAKTEKRFCMSLATSGSVSWMRWEVGRSVRDNSVKVRRKEQVTRDGSPAS